MAKKYKTQYEKAAKIKPEDWDAEKEREDILKGAARGETSFLIGKPRPIDPNYKPIIRTPKNYLFSSGMLNASAIAKDLISIEPMPKGGENIFYLDKEKEMEDPKNPFSSNCDGTPVGPDSFGGSDEGSHYMSNTSAAKIKEEFYGESFHDCTSVEEMRTEMKERLYPPKRPAHLQKLVDDFREDLRKAEQSNEPLYRREGNHIMVGKRRPIAPDFEPIIGGASMISKETMDYLNKSEPERVAKSSPHFDENPIDAWIQTHSGRKFYPLNPDLDSIDIEDIAHSLSNLCRFTGHVDRFYSVAQHCVLVSYLCDSKDSLHGLLHDASEFALQDLPSPLKHSGYFEQYKIFEKNLQNMIYKAFNLSEQEPESVKKADKLLLTLEAQELMSPLHPDWKRSSNLLPFKIESLPPKKAKELFLNRFEELVGGDISRTSPPLTVKSIMDDK